MRKRFLNFLPVTLVMYTGKIGRFICFPV